jgi:hypothetical protein
MHHWNVLIRGILFVILFLSIFEKPFAQTPVVSLDGNPETEGISPVPGALITGETILVAVTVSNIHTLHSYSVKCVFDAQVVNFNGAVSKLSISTPAFLESHHGHIAAFLSIPGNGTAEIAATQAGKDRSTCADGDGILGYLSFTAKTKGNPHIKIAEAHLVDPDGKYISTEIN